MTATGTTAPLYGPDADPDKANRPPSQTPFLLTLDQRTTDEFKDHWPTLHLPKLKKDRDGLKWAFRSVNPDLTSTHGYRWPFPGNWAAAAGPFHPGAPCPRSEGDGLCLARTLAGAASGGIKAGAGLICAYLESDLLGNDSEKWRVKRAWVGEVIGTITELTLRSADLGSADLGSADLGSADLGSANLRSANLRSANLRYADLRYADLRSADLGYANLRYANLGSADLGYADLGSADLGYANLRYANLRSADLGYANLGSADLGSANLGSADLESANLGSANLGSANLAGSYLAGARYSQLTLWPDGFKPGDHGAVLKP